MAYSNGSATIEQDTAEQRKPFVGGSGEDVGKKIFVGGLSPETTEDDLNTYFAQFGTVQHSTVKRDLTTGFSRCFGFVTFGEADALQKLHTVPVHTLNGKKIDPKPAEARSGEEVCRKVFVGGVDPALEEEEVKAYFEKFGKVQSIHWPKDRLRDNAKKNFVFVEFEEASTVDALVANPKHTIGSRQCDIRKAVPAVRKYIPAGAGYGADAYGNNAYAGQYAGGYGAAAGYDPSAYAGYYYGAAAGGYDPAAYAAAYGGDASAYATGTYDYGAAASYAAADPSAARGGYVARGDARGGAARGFHPYRRV